MKHIKISVITVSLNADAAIEQAIKSVCSQSYDNIEYIIIDGGSTDKTVEIIQRYEDKIAYWVSEPDNGLYDAMNKGLDHCTGDVVAFLGSDDYYPAGALEYVAGYFENTEELDVLCGEVLVDKCGELCEHYNPWEENPKRLREGFMWYCHQGVFSRRTCFEQCGVFNTEYEIVADYDWLLRVYNSGKTIRYSHEKLCIFGWGGISANSMRVIPECRRIAEKSALELYDRKELQYSEYERLLKNIKYAISKQYINVYLDNRDSIMIKKKSGNHNLNPHKMYSIFGAGKMGTGCLRIFEVLGIQAGCFWDNGEAKWGRRIEGIPVRNPEEISKENTFIIVASQYYEDDIVNQLKGMGLCEGRDFIRLCELCDQIEVVEI